MAQRETSLDLTGPDLMLANLSWPEVAAIRDKVEVVLIPVGSNEQHGPNLALSMDITGATEFCLRASILAYPRLLVAPGPAWGVSFHQWNETETDDWVVLGAVHGGDNGYGVIESSVGRFHN